MADVMNDWLGDGGWPVEASRATMRAQICQTCPMNTREQGLAARIRWTLKELCCSGIRRALSVKRQMAISVPEERFLHGCMVCGCALKLKIHVPIKSILEGVTEKQEQAFRYHSCWIIKEKDQE